MIAASVGVGTGDDAAKAGREACMQALSGLPSLQKADVIIVFGSGMYDHAQLIAGVSLASPDTLIVGCSTAGEISSEGLSTEHSVVLLAMCSDQVRFWGGIGTHILTDPREAGAECARQLEYSSHGYMTSCLTFLDVLSGNGDATLQAFLEKVGASFPTFGGAAADDMHYFETYQYLDKKAYRGSIVSLGISGDYTAAAVSGHGFLPIGIARIATRAEGTMLYELDGKPAASIYEEYFGEEHLTALHEGLLPSLAISYPLGVFTEESNDVMLRNPVFVDRQGAMTFASAIPLGAEIRLMISDIERGLETAATAAMELLQKLNGKKPKAIIIVNSVARKKMLGLRADEEIEIIQRIVGRDVPMVGYYSYAQIERQPGENLHFHNGSLLLFAIAE